MATIDRATIQHVASLAKLKLSDEELSYYEGQLKQVVDFFGQMDQLADKLGKDWRGDTKGSPTPERHDEARTFGAIDDVMAQAPSRVGTAFQVPKIIE